MPDERRAVPGRPGRAGDLRRPRAHQGHLPPPRQARLLRRRPRAVRPAGRRRRRSSDIQEIISKVVSKVPDAQVMSDLDATVAWAKATGKGDTAKLGITGFCWGGRIVWLYAAHNPDLKAGVAWYGRLVGDADRAAAEAPDRPGRRPQGPGARPLRRRRQGHPGRDVEEMRGGPQGGRQDRRDHRLPRHPPRLLRRLPAELPQGQAEDGWKRLLAWFRAHGL